MAKDDYKKNRRKVAARHDPPLVHMDDAAEVLGKSVYAARWALDYYQLEVFLVTGPFSRGKYYKLTDVEELATRLAQKQLR